MNTGYEEILEGERVFRAAPGERHERVLARLHAAVHAAIGVSGVARLLPARSPVELAAGTLIRPDLAVVTAATGKLWLAAEIIEAGGHHVDTVRKKEVFENARVPRLWMIDLRYDYIEVYASGPHGLGLSRMLGGTEKLSEGLLPGLNLVVRELFATG